MLFYPLEEQFDLPTAAIELRDRERWQREVVGQEDQLPFAYDVVVADAPQGLGISLRRQRTRQHDGLVGAQSSRFVDRSRLASLIGLVVLGANDEECRLAMHSKQSREIEVAFVHQVKGAGLDQQFVEKVDFVRFPGGNANKGGDVAAQIQERVQFHGRFVTAKWCPGKERQAEIDRRRVERVGRVVQLHAEAVVGVKATSPGNQYLREVEVNSPVAQAVGIAQRAPRNASAKARVIQLGLDRTQASLDVPQALAKGELRESHAQELIAAREAARPIVATVATHTSIEFVPRKNVHQLRENQLPDKHARPFAPAKGSK